MANHFTARMIGMCAAVFFLAGQLSAQQPIPDSLDLFDPRFFRDPEAGNKVVRLWDARLPAGLSRMVYAEEVLRYAEQVKDPAAQMAGLMICGDILFAQGDYPEALQYFNRSLALDSLLPPYSPVAERVKKVISIKYSELGAKNSAIEMLRQVIRNSELRDKAPTLRLYHHCSDMAGIMISAGMTDSALAYSRKAVALARELGLQEYIWPVSALNNLGYVYLEIGNNDSALALFQRAYAMFSPKTRKDTLFAGSVTDNIGMALERKGRYGEALPYYEENVLRFRNSNDEGRYSNALVASARVCIALGNLPKAGSYIDSLAVFGKRKTKPESHRLRVHRIQLLMAYDSASGNLKGALEMSRMLQNISDSLYKQDVRKKFAAMDLLLHENAAAFNRQIEMERKARWQQEQETRITRNFIYVVAFLGLLSVVLAVLLLRRRIARSRSKTENEIILRQLAELRLAKEKLETEKLNRELELKRRDITDMAIHISVRNKLSAEWLDNLKKIKASKDPMSELQQLILQLKNQQQGGEEKRMLPQHVEQVNNEFYEKLKTRFPDLTRSENDLCGMIRMRLAIKEIAAIRNISSHAVRVAKHRLKKKMKLGQEQDLDSYIQEM